MNANNEQAGMELSTEQFLRRWMPQVLTPRDKSEFLMDLERLVLRRTLEIDRHSGDASGDPDRFDWNNDGTVAVKRVYALAVYQSVDGDLVIRQQRSDGDDIVVVIPLRCAASVIDAIQRQLRGAALASVQSRHPER